MFDKLRQAFSKIGKLAKERKISERELSEILYDFQLSLLESDVAQEVTDELIDNIKSRLVGKSIERSQNANLIVKEAIKDTLISKFREAGQIDIISSIKQKKMSGEPYIILFLGINGTGKTTTIAKFGNYLKRNGISVICAAADTHRAGAIEQLAEHASKVSMKVISQRYGADPAAVGRDGILYAKTHHIDVLLIDTAGRMQTNVNLMEEMAKINRVVKPDLKVLVVDSLTGNDSISQAKLFERYVGFDCVVLTKVDADVKGGSGLSIVYTTKKPIIFIGTGQRYEDLKEFDYEEFVDSLIS